MDATAKVLAFAIEEQRLTAQQLHDDFTTLKNRTLTYLGGGLAVLTFLYSRGQGLFIPGTIYGKVFYFAGLGTMIGALILLLYALFPSDWEIPTENAKLRTLDIHDEVEYLTYVKNRYVACYDVNIRTYSARQRMVNAVFTPLVCGATILVVLNLFGG